MAIHRRLKEGDERRGKPVIAAGFSVVRAESLRLSPETSVESFWQPIIVDGLWHGKIVDQPRGDGGFGYDPHFYLPEFDKTAAELIAEQKNQISHRGLALAKLVGILHAGKF